jgi:hypothetical protein
MASYDIWQESKLALDLGLGLEFAWPWAEEEYLLPDGSQVFWTGGRAVQFDSIKTHAESAYGICNQRLKP